MKTSPKFTKISSYKALFLSVGVASLLSITPAIAQNELIPLDDVAGGTFNSEAFAVSGDGTTVVGTGRPVTGLAAFKWTAGTLIEDLGDLAGGATTAQALDVSANGSVIVGQGRSASGPEAFRLTGGVMTGLGDLTGGIFSSIAYGVSDDGLVVVGSSTSTNGTEAFRWVGGVMTGLGDLPGGTFSSVALDTNSDGSIVVGNSLSSATEQAFSWTSGTGMEALGFLAGGANISSANAISSDGSIIVGRSTSAAGLQAFRYDGATMSGIGDLAGGAFSSEAFDVSSNGSVIVGESTSAAGVEAFRWTAETGMETVNDWLTNEGVDTTGYTILSTAQGVSSDGSVVVGSGTTANGTEAFLARVSPIGSGVLNTESVNQSIVESATIVGLSNIAISLPLNGAHHRPLMLEYNNDSNYGGWFTADGAFNDDGDREGYLSNQEAGVYGDFLSKQLRVGFGFGLSKSEQDTNLSGEQELSGEYGIVEVNYSPLRLPVIFGVTGLYGQWDMDATRGYLNGLTPDSSSGTTDLNAGAVRLSTFWQDAGHFKINKLGTITFSPKAAFTISKTKIDGYTETGGGFPVRFDDIDIRSKEARVGVEVGSKLKNKKTEIRVTLEAVSKFDAGNTNVSGDLVGLSSFDLNSASANDTWGRVGLDVDHRFNNDITLSGTTFLSSTGADPDVSGAISLKVPF